MSGASGIEPERLARALGLLAFVLAQPGDRIPMRTLTTELGMNGAEVEEDVALLNLVNFGGGTYLLYAQVEGGDLVVERDLGADAMASPARLSPTLARSVLLALDLVGHVLPLEPGEADGLRSKLNSLLDDPEAAHPARAGALTPAAPEVLEVLASAVREHRLARIEYFTPTRDELAERDVEPYELRDTGDAWYLEAFCLRNRSARTFRVDRIRYARLLPAVFAPRPEMSEAVPSGLRAGAEAGAGTASGTARADVHWALLRQPAWRETALREAGLAFEKSDDGCLLVHLPYFDGEWLVGEVLAGLGQTVLVEPKGEVPAVIRAARDLLHTYTEP